MAYLSFKTNLTLKNAYTIKLQIIHKMCPGNEKIKNSLFTCSVVTLSYFIFLFKNHYFKQKPSIFTIKVKKEGTLGTKKP